MMGVGACDAYFCDAYADLVSRALRAKDLEPPVTIPDRLNNLRVPVVAVLRKSSGGWRWRMAARELIERESVLSLKEIKELFNTFFPKTRKLLSEESIEPWILHRKASVRLLGLSASKYRRKSPADKATAKKTAVSKLNARFEQIFQRRNDCIHNCDRPKVALQPIAPVQVEKTLRDIEFLVSRCHEAFLAEFPVYLNALGFSPTTRNRVCL